MNDLQKLAHNFVEAFKPLNDVIDQMCRIAQKPLFDMPGVNSKGMVNMADALKSSLANTNLKMMKDKDILSEEFENKVNAMLGNAEITSNTERDTHFAGAEQKDHGEIYLFLSPHLYHAVDSTALEKLKMLTGITTKVMLTPLPDMLVLPDEGKS